MNWKRTNKHFLTIAMALLIVALLVAAGGITYAAGTITGNTANDWTAVNSKVAKVTVTWVDDTSGTTGTIYVPTAYHGRYVYSAETNPGATAPTDGYAIAITKSNGVNCFGTALGSLDTANSEVWVPNVDGYVFVDGNLTFTLSGNAVNNATGTLTLYLLVYP